MKAPRKNSRLLIDSRHTVVTSRLGSVQKRVNENICFLA